MTMVWVKTKAGRVAYTAMDGGSLIPTDRYVLVARTPWISILIEKHKDVVEWDGVGAPPDSGVLDPPLGAVIGQQWTDPLTGSTYVYASDGASSFWLQSPAPTFPLDPYIGARHVDGLTTFVCVNDSPVTWAPQDTAVLPGDIGPQIEVAEPVAAGQPLNIGVDGRARLARADDPMLSGVAGLAAATAAAGHTTRPMHGYVQLPDWTAATGAAALVVGSLYWLGSTAGQITTTAPTATGMACVRIGRAIAADTLDVNLFSIQL